MAADPMNSFTAGPRHAPKPDIAAPELERRKPVGSFSTRAAEVNGTGSLLSGVKHKSPKSAGSMSGLQRHESPLQLGGGMDEIIEASGLGKQSERPDSDEPMDDSAGAGHRPPPMTDAERWSDADAPSQAITTGADGSLMHHRIGVDGSITSRGIGSYSPNYFGSEL